MTPQNFDAKETLIEVADRWDQITLLRVWMTEANVNLEGRPIAGGPLPLSSGRRVWVTTGAEDVEPNDPEPAPAGQIIVPQSPTVDGVAAPGFLVCGLNIA